jgi:RNA binding exosome subunit
MLAHNVELTVFSTPEDDLKKVEENFMRFLPFDMAKEKLKINKKQAMGFSERQITILSIMLGKQRHVNQFLKHLNSILNPEQKEHIIRQMESRVDDSMYFFMRFDKQRLIEEGVFWLTDRGTCYHIKMALAPFPRRKEKAYDLVRQIFV